MEKTIRKHVSDSCVICFDDTKPTYIFIPCGHKCLCKKCSDIYKNKTTLNIILYKCPICREKYTEIKIDMSEYQIEEFPFEELLKRGCMISKLEHEIAEKTKTLQSLRNSVNNKKEKDLEELQSTPSTSGINQSTQSGIDVTNSGRLQNFVQIKFRPHTDYEEQSRIRSKYQNITSISPYWSKSSDELRLQYYIDSGKINQAQGINVTNSERLENFGQFKFRPGTGNDGSLKLVNVKFQNITSMSAYRSKSSDELRLQYYTNSGKISQAQNQSSTTNSSFSTLPTFAIGTPLGNTASSLFRTNNTELNSVENPQHNGSLFDNTASSLFRTNNTELNSEENPQHNGSPFDNTASSLYYTNNTELNSEENPQHNGSPFDNTASSLFRAKNTVSNSVENPQHNGSLFDNTASSLFRANNTVSNSEENPQYDGSLFDNTASSLFCANNTVSNSEGNLQHNSSIVFSNYLRALSQDLLSLETSRILDRHRTRNIPVQESQNVNNSDSVFQFQATPALSDRNHRRPLRRIKNKYTFYN